jgi:hypothetical protein
MVDIRGPFGDLKTFLNSGVLDPIAALKAPVFAAGNVTVGEVGVSGQLRAGHTLAATDFTAQGLAVPLGLWNLSDLTDASGNGRALTNKGSVPFGVGINGAATTAAVFAGSTGQALYIADTGAADPFRIKTGSWGCWFRTAKRGVAQWAVTKVGAAGTIAVLCYGLYVSANNVAQTSIADGTNTTGAVGTSDIADDRWHFVVATHDGTRNRLYVDGALEAQAAFSGSLNQGSAAPLDIGGYGADGATAAVAPFYGRVDEAFVTADVLSDDQIRNLYAARIPHTLTVVPGDVRILVRRRRRGGPLATTDFPTTPVRLHNFTAGALTDQGTGGIALGATGTPIVVAGADGVGNGGYAFANTVHNGLASTDAGLPSGLAARSYGLWFKTSTVGAFQGLIGWATPGTADTRLDISTTGTIRAVNGSDVVNATFVADGLWHHTVVVEDNAAGDGVKRKLYLDGKLISGSTIMQAVTLAGANRFRVGAAEDGTEPTIGSFDGAFVHSVALTGEQVRALWNVGSQQLAPSPKDATDHVEAVTSTDLLAVLDTIESSDSVDLLVAP